MLAVLGLHDDYVGQGLPLSPALQPGVVPYALRTPVARELASLYKQLQAPVGEFGRETLMASTAALAAGDPGDTIYTHCTAQLSKLGAQRDSVAATIQRTLLGVERHGWLIDPAGGQALARAAEAVLAHALSTEEYCS